jgi:hypothetical protein
MVGLDAEGSSLGLCNEAYLGRIQRLVSLPVYPLLLLRSDILSPNEQYIVEPVDLVQNLDSP